MVAAVSLQNWYRVDDIINEKTINIRSHLQQNADYMSQTLHFTPIICVSYDSDFEDRIFP